jgi:hypothetical protein
VAKGEELYQESKQKEVEEPEPTVTEEMERKVSNT